MHPIPRLTTVATLLLAAMAALATLPAHAAADDKLLAAARAAQPAVIESLREMVAIESGTMDAPGISKMADYAERRLKALGLQVERRKPSTGNGELLVGQLAGTGKAKLMLLAHMDTVYWPCTLDKQPIKQDGNKLYGPGIADDKGGIAMILHALAILKQAGWQDYARLTVLLNGDEESGSAGSGQAIASLGAEQDVVLSYEPTAAMDPGVLLAAAGVSSISMTVKGRASHAGAAPEVGRNALIEASNIVLQTADIAKAIPGAQLNWTTLKAGNVRNQIPELAEAGADVRLTATDAADKLMAALRAKADSSKKVPDTEVNFVFNLGRPPFVGDARTLALAKKAQAIHAELGGAKPLSIHPGTGGGTDAGFAAQSGKAVVLESLGLPGWGYHAKDEYIDIDAIVPRLYLSTRLLMDLGKGD